MMPSRVSKSYLLKHLDVFYLALVFDNGFFWLVVMEDLINGTGFLYYIFQPTVSCIYITLLYFATL